MNPTNADRQKRLNVNNVEIKKENATFNQESSYIDVTNRVRAQLDKEGYITLYMDQQKIGRLPVEGYEEEFSSEFTAGAGERTEDPAGPGQQEAAKSYVDGCDMGWC
ncbi:DUF2553 family protein [Alteribacter natronophilus]|uniref:DUF2553 family protein n=1 Tax=Alteribacter natronophilus TaxID=2583810 RepID=UPI00110EB78F|nr:DUF2553 family protein [Alteribacter natronophilus]TMW72456.1 DUF2553 family protein [Alteribacter natronophilus]